VPETYILLPHAETTRKIEVIFSAFPDGDTHCVIENTKKVQGKSALIVHRLYPNQNEQLVRLVLLIDLLKDLGITDISVFCPYLPYSRQDKRHLPGEALGAYTLCRMLAGVECKRLYTIDCHFMRGRNEAVYEGLPLISFTAADTLLEICVKKYIGNRAFHIVGADEGAGLLTPHVGERHMHKSRGDYAIEDKVSKRDVTKLMADHLSLVHSTVIIMDDMVSTGTTMLRAIYNLQVKEITKIYCVVTHGLFLGDSYKELKRITGGIIASDTIDHSSAVPLVDALLSEKIIPHWLDSDLNLGTK
jgi:ribose-phosphate pyrophosphokinase